MKKLSLLIASVVIASSLTACGGTATTGLPDTGNLSSSVTAAQDAKLNPPESGDQYDINMKNAELNLDLVE